MKIDLFGDVHKAKVIEITGSAEELELQSDNAVFDEDVSVTCTIHRDGTFTRIEAEVKTVATCECARCLEAFTREITSSFEIVVGHLKQGQAPPEEATDEDEETVTDDILYLPYGEMSIDITGDVRDALLLEIPYKVICSEDCKGLCQTCGVNLNEGSCDCTGVEIDGRWQALSGLKSDADNNSNS